MRRGVNGGASRTSGSFASADRIWLMDRGGGVHIGTPEGLTRDGSLEHFFNLPDSEKRIRIHFDLNVEN